jgi:hypothetical protein
MVSAMYRHGFIKKFWVGGLSSLLVLSCGGGPMSTAGISGTGVDDGTGQTNDNTNVAGISGTGITTGTITGFGSIFVNGKEYEVDDSTTIDVDGTQLIDVSTHKTTLKIGMQVRLQFTTFDNGTISANSVVYDDNVEGPITSPITLISANKKTFEVMGVTVQIDKTATSFEDASGSSNVVFGFDSIKQGDVLEVSGLPDSTGKVSATLVEKKSELPAPSIELHVTVPAITTPGTFTVNPGGLIVNYDVNGINTEFDDLPNNIVEEGQLVEIKGTFDGIDTITATKIEYEGGSKLGLGSTSNSDANSGSGDDSSGDGASSTAVSFSIQGFISGLNLDLANQTASFTIIGSPLGDVPVQVIQGVVPLAILEQLEEGMNVEVEGTTQDNVTLLADEVEIRQSSSRYVARVKSVSPGAGTVEIEYPGVAGSIMLRTDSVSSLRQGNSAISLADLSPGNEVDVDARVMTDGVKYINSLKLEADTNGYKLGGLVQAVQANSIKIDDLTFVLNGLTQYDDEDPNLNSWTDIQVGDSIEVEDDDFDGTADDVSVHTP